MVGMPVSDHDRGLEFHVGVLGLEKRHDYFFGDDDRWIEVAPIGSETTIALVLAPQRVEPENETGIRLSVQTNHDRGVDDLTAMHAELRDRGVMIDSQVSHIPGVPPMFSVRDPDGNILKIIASEHRA